MHFVCVLQEKKSPRKKSCTQHRGGLVAPKEIRPVRFMIRSFKFYFMVAKGKCIKEQMVPAPTKGEKIKESAKSGVL